MPESAGQTPLTEFLEKGIRLLEDGQHGPAEKQLLRGWQLATMTSDAKPDPALKGDMTNLFRQIAGLNLDQKHIASARLFFDTLRRLDPENNSDHFNLARCAYLQGDFSESITGFKAVLKKDPREIKALLYLGSAHSEAGNFTEAIDALESYVKGAPKDPEGLVELGLAYERAGQDEAAGARFDEVKIKHPEYFDKLFELADKYLEQDLFSLSQRTLLRVEKIARKDASLFFHFGIRYFAMHATKDAERVLKYTIKLRSYPHAYREMASFYEKSNQIDKAMQFARIPAQVAPDDPTVNLILGKIEGRQGETDQALQRLKKYVELAESPHLQAGFYNIIGKLLDKKGAVEEAYEAFQKSKDLLKPTEEYKKQDIGFPPMVMDEYSHMNLGDLPRFPPQRVHAREPKNLVFFVGFPRSGTTLIQTVLDAHPEIVTVDEKQVLRGPTRILKMLPKAYPGSVLDLTEEQISMLRKLYFYEMKNHVDFDEKTTLIDKLPFDIINIPLILVLFPDAKIIFGLRHPCAACLSCLMQHFQLNRVMANMMSLDEITRFYAQIMGHWQKIISECDVPYHYVRYENVVENLEKEARALVDFLGLEWSDKVLKYADHAKAKGLISTPSYSQVVQPIYKGSKDKWRQYEEYFKPYRARLEPFLKLFGYSG